MQKKRLRGAGRKDTVSVSPKGAETIQGVRAEIAAANHARHELDFAALDRYDRYQEQQSWRAVLADQFAAEYLLACEIGYANPRVTELFLGEPEHVYAAFVELCILADVPQAFHTGTSKRSPNFASPQKGHYE